MEFRDLKAQYRRYKVEIDSAIQKVLDDANFIGGKQVPALEERLAQYVGVKHCITCANGTDAMTLLMMAWGIKEGDAVFVPDFTFFSTGEIVSYSGATPVFVDVDEQTFNIDTQMLERAIQKTVQQGVLEPKAIIPVDLFGLPANYPAIEELARRYDLIILEDAAQGFGGSINNRKAGSFGHASATSFFPAKPVGCYGDGGAIFTNDSTLATLLASLKVHGKGESKYDNLRIGLNSRLDTIQAAVLDVKLTAFVSHELADVNRVFAKYTDLLHQIVHTPYIPEDYISSFAQYTIRLESKEQRNHLQSELAKQGIPTMIYYTKPMHKQQAFSYIDFDETQFNITNRLCDTVLSLPMHPYLDDQEIEVVSKAITNILRP